MHVKISKKDTIIYINKYKKIRMINKNNKIPIQIK